MHYIGCLLTVIQRLRAGRPRPYLDKKFTIVLRRGKTVGFHAHYINFRIIHKIDGGAGYFNTGAIFFEKHYDTIVMFSEVS
jgi:hypothetical protein